MNPDWETTKGYIWRYECTWPAVQDWSRSTLGCRPQGVAGRSPADLPQTEPERSEMIHLINIPGKKKSDQSRVTYWESAGKANEDDTLLSLTGLITNTNAGQGHFSSLKTKLHWSHWRSQNPDLLQHEHAQFAIIFRSFLGGQKRSEETVTYKVGINVLPGSLF